MSDERVKQKAMETVADIYGEVLVLLFFQLMFFISFTNRLLSWLSRSSMRSSIQGSISDHDLKQVLTR
jgi:hypothetical protein